MRFEDVEARLRRLPAVLPPVPAELDARVFARAGDPPAWLRGAMARPARDAAALVLIYPETTAEAHVVLIERPAGDHVHAGQIAFPGGKRDDGDVFPQGTALREAAEEVGLDAAEAGVTTLGQLDSVDVRVSGHLLVPVLAVTRTLPALAANAQEVKRVLRVPVDAFLPGAAVEQVDEVREGWRLRYGAYRLGELRVWGATARILGQLGAVLQSRD